MHGDEHPAIRSLRDSREATIEGLSVAFARDELSIDEFELRVDAAFASAKVSELNDLLADLGPEARQAAQSDSMRPKRIEDKLVTTVEPELVPSSTGPLVSNSVHPARTPRALAVFGNVERRGHIRMAPKSQVVSVFGNIEMDLRSAEWTSPVSEIEVRTVFGNVELTVPPNLTVICEGMGVFGSFASMNRVPGEGGAAGPTLRIVGVAVFGNFEIRTMPAGVEKRSVELLGDGR